MRLSRLADYAVLLMTHMAQHRQRAHTAAEVAAATRLPPPTVSKVLARLCHEGLLTSSRGVKGGYALARSPQRISVDSIVTALEGPIALVPCVDADGRHCEVEPLCPSRIGLHRINAAMRDALSEISLADIAAPPVKMPPVRPSADHSTIKAHR